MKKPETITDQHYNGWDPECGVEFTCSKCWKVCLRWDYKFCPFCGVELIWDIDENKKNLYNI